MNLGSAQAPATGIPQVRQRRGYQEDPGGESTPEHQNTLTEQRATSCLRLPCVLGTTALPRSAAHHSGHFLPSLLCCHHQPRPLRARGTQQSPAAWLLSPPTLPHTWSDGQVAQDRTPPCCWCQRCLLHGWGRNSCRAQQPLYTLQTHKQPERQTRGNSWAQSCWFAVPGSVLHTWQSRGSPPRFT